MKTADPADSPQTDGASRNAGPEPGTAVPSTGRITGFLSSWRKGSPEAPGRLFELVYQELHALAHRQLDRGPRDGTLSTTALVHEAYLKLGDHERLELHDRGHFFALAARAMRQIVLDGARRHAADKRGGGLRRIELEDGKIACEERATEILALDAALEKLEALDPRLAAVVELRFYGGLSVEESAEALGSSPRTIKRDWQKARAFLFRELTPSGSG